MRRWHNLFSAILAAAAAGAAEFDPESWQFRAPILLPDTAAEFVRLPLTPEILDKAQPALADLRVADRDLELIPFIIHWPPRRETAVEWRELRLINRTYEDGQWARAVVDFGGNRLKSSVDVTLSGDNYRRFVLLEGGYDTQSWQAIDSGWLISVSERGEAYAADTLDFPENDFRYLRLTVANMEDEPGRIEIVRVGASHETAADSPEPIAAVVAEIEKPNQPPGSSRYAIDLGFTNLPLAHIEAAPNDTHFYRGYTLYAVSEVERDNGFGPFTEETEIETGRGVIYRMEREGKIIEQLRIDGVPSQYKKFILEIHHGNDRPLDLPPENIRVARYPLPSIVFPATPGARYDLYFGSAGYEPVSFDLAATRPDLAARTLPIAGTGPAELIVAAAVPWYGDATWWVWGSLALASGAVGWLIAANLRKIK